MLNPSAPEDADQAGERRPLPANRGQRPWAWVAGLIALGVVTHLGWFGGGVLTAGDWGYLSPDSLRALLEAPQAWDGATAFGRPNEALSGVPYELAMGGLAALGAPYPAVERIVFFFPFAVLPLLAMFWLASRFTASNIGRATAAAVYGLNTYILVIGTNQLTVAMAYAIAPFAIGAFLDALDQRRLRGLQRAALAGFALAVATAYDPRIGYLIAGALAVLATASAVAARDVRRPLSALGIALATTVALHLYWVLPATGGSLRSSISGLLPDDPFVSFANVVHAVGLNHPFWTGGEPAVFVVQDPLLPLLGLPIVAAGAFLFADVRRDWRLVTLGALALAGVFCVKGENAPLGGVYGWAFDTLPGFRLFRDMSKFNLYVSLGYAVLSGVVAAWAAASVASAVRDPVQRRSASTLVAAQALLLLVLALGFSAWPAMAHRLGGMFESAEVPAGYLRFEELLHGDDRFGRVLWLPATTRFTTQTDMHPSVPALDLLDRLGDRPSGVVRNELAEIVVGRAFADTARSLGIRYVAVDRVADATAWESAAALSTDRGRSTIDAWLDTDPALIRVVSTRTLDVYRIRGQVRYAELTAPLAYWSSGEKASEVPGYATVGRDALKKSLQRVRASTTPAGDVIALPAESARIKEDELVSRPFTVDRPSTFRIRWSHARPGVGDTLSVVGPHREVVWSGGAATSEQLTLDGPAKYRLVVRSRAINANLLADGSFEEALWGPVGDALNYDKSSLKETGIRATTSPDARHGMRSLRLDAKRHIAGISSPPLRVRVGDTAVVRFAWRSVAGPPPGYAPYLGRSVRTRRIDLIGRPGWNAHVDVFEVRRGAESLAVLFYAGPGGDSIRTTALFDDVEVAIIPRWLAKPRLEPTAPQNRLPVVTSEDLRRMSATIRGTGTYVLRVKSNFDPGWRAAFRLRMPGGWASETNAQHVRTTDGMNAWVLKIPAAPARVEATLSYAPQRWVTAGASGSLLALLGLVFGSLYVRRTRP